MKRQAIVLLGYFALYLAYLFVHLEGEIGHWLGLVILPSALLFATSRQSVHEFQTSVGFRKGTILRGVLIGAAVGIALGSIQLLMSRRRTEALAMIRSGEALVAYPLATLLMLATAGFTEEFFFRGLLLTRVRQWARSAFVAIGVSAFCFGIYHLPYAYLNPAWPSHGDWSAALTAAFGQGGIMGIVLGAVFVLTRENLPAVMLTHACFNAVWAMTMLQY